MKKLQYYAGYFGSDNITTPIRYLGKFVSTWRAKTAERAKKEEQLLMSMTVDKYVNFNDFGVRREIGNTLLLNVELVKKNK